ncbi:MAG: hypothetical protein COA78_32935 [Blastopirellula sp.]|nr:MAG: hypothetical protein COA78_32935 [Blastopirellula sp.]
MTITTGVLTQDLRMIVTFNPISIDEDTPLSSLLEQVYSSGIHHWPVVDQENHVIGIVSDTDVVKAGMACLSVDSKHSLTEPVSAFMSDQVLTVDQAACPMSTLKLMLEKRINSLPVVQNNQLQAIVTTSDYIRDYYLINQNGDTEIIASYLDRTPVLVDASQALETARVNCLSEGSDYAVVMQGNCPLGVISKRDINHYLCRGIAHSFFEEDIDSEQQVAAVLRESKMLLPTDHLADAAQIMCDYRLHAVAIVNHQHEFVGIITQDHLLQQILDS